ncbi:MAG: M1 family peptidase, partial [Actinobacteria bacterium]|nr:M1 family peptidase [Actinomycetota bacterium]
NDQPADKALYDITVSVPAPAQGIANGVLESTTTADGVTTNSWHLDEPAASYLVTVATGDYTVEEDVSSSGVPLQYWAPTPQRRLIQGLRQTADGLDWLEEKLGPYPFDSLGVLLVDSRSGMETQTMITLGMTDYTTSGAVLVHEAAHQWYGDLVTPSDWRDVWMNEGMAMYLQANWSAEEDGQPLDATLDYWASIAPQLLRDGGPAAAYDPATFGTSNIYYVPALMWHELRLRLGTDRFWSLVRAWPEEHAGQNADYDEITTWWEEQTGLELTAFFDSWLLGDTLPARA